MDTDPSQDTEEINKEMEKLADLIIDWFLY